MDGVEMEFRGLFIYLFYCKACPARCPPANGFALRRCPKASLAMIAQ